MDEDMINNLSSMLKNGNIPDNIKDMISNFSNSSGEEKANSSSNNIDPNMISSLLGSLNSNSSSDNNSTSNTSSNIDIETIMKMKTIIDKMNINQNDPRANLLRSLKPYLRSSRKDKLEQYVKLLNMTNIVDVFGFSGGEKKK